MAALDFAKFSALIRRWRQRAKQAFEAARVQPEDSRMHNARAMAYCNSADEAEKLLKDATQEDR